MKSLLQTINSPQDIKKVSSGDIPRLLEEIREFLISTVLVSGGHLASNLGVVELSVALHRVFDSPKDKIIWDVGHQSYIHKMITGRKEKLSTLRQYGGLSGFTKRAESEHDPFGAGHSSTSLSAAIGFAQAEKLKGSGNYTVAIVGDGAFTGGMIHEALNNCRNDLRLIIILNENEMSISKNVGNLSAHLSKLRVSPRYFDLKHKTQSVLSRLRFVGKPLAKIMRDTKKSIKTVIYNSNYFEELGLYYLGPADGNDYFTTEFLLREAKARNSSVIIHLKTSKGKGYAPALRNPERYHTVRPAAQDVQAGELYSDLFARALIDIAKKDPKICAITAAMCSGTGLEQYRRAFPARFFDVGIAESHAVTFAAGLAANGMMPVFAVYSSFLQRAYDNILHDLSLQTLPCVLCVGCAGLAPADGVTHHGVFDVAFLSQIENTQIYTPVRGSSLKDALEEAAASGLISALRFPKGREDRAVTDLFRQRGKWIHTAFEHATDGFEHTDCVIITYGRIVSEAIAAARNTTGKMGVILLEKIKPYDEAARAVCELLPQRPCQIIFLEEGIRSGGAGMLLYDKLREYDSMKNKIYEILAIDTLPEHGPLADLYRDCRISRANLCEAHEAYRRENAAGFVFTPERIL